MPPAFLYVLEVIDGLTANLVKVDNNQEKSQSALVCVLSNASRIPVR